MASPVDTSVKFFSSALMANAPVLNGVAGALIALLDAVLVNGFDTKSLTGLTVAAGVATAAFSGTHSAVEDSVILVAGVSGGPTGYAGLNGEQKVTAAALGSVKFATTLPDGTYTGTMTIKMAPAGWEKVYSGTNLAAYRSLDLTSTRMFLRVDDTNAQFARVVGYEAMTDVNTGTNPFPTTAQMSGGGYWPKSVNSNSTAVDWQVFADAKMFYYIPVAGRSTQATYLTGVCRGFGDLVPLRGAGDPYLCCLNYSATASVGSQLENGLETNSASQTAVARGLSGLGGSALHFSAAYMGAPATTEYSGNTARFGSFPGDVDGGLYLSKKVLCPTGQTYPRAELPGALHMAQSLGFDTFKANTAIPGTRDFAGRRLVAAVTSASGATFSQVSSASNSGVMFFDKTGPWR